MSIEKKILDLADKKDTFSANDAIKELGSKYGRAYVLKFIRQLINERKLSKSGSTRLARYARKDKENLLGNVFEKRYTNKNLDDYHMWEEFAQALPLISRLEEHIKSILSYAFTEMANNAIDHSKSKNIEIKLEKTGSKIRFVVDDFGIGIFRNIMKQRNLKSD